MKLNEKQQEIFFKLNQHEQNMKHLQEQLQAVERGIFDLTSLDKGLDEIKETANDDSNKEKEILSHLGRGIFVKTKLVSDELIVDVGNRNFVKKEIPETKKMIKEQLKKLEKVHEELEKNIEETDKNLTNLLIEAQKTENSR